MRTVKAILSFAMLLAAVAAKGATVTLTGGTSEVTLQNNDVLTGTGGTETHVTIADGATVTLNGVNITAIPNDYSGHQWAGITCESNAVIILQGYNVVKGGYEDYPGIFVPVGGTLRIQGKGALDASSNGNGAGIGGGYLIDCGDIAIAGGIITATGGIMAAGVGGGQESSCGSITIMGGTVTATGGMLSPGIGGGAGGTGGSVVIEEAARCVTAISGEDAPCSIGAGAEGECGTVTVEGVVQTGGVAASPYIYNPCITNITSAADWDAFASRVSRGVDTYEDLTVTLAGNISVSTMVGKTVDNTPYPFSGTFDGGGHTLTVGLSAPGAVAPFSAVSGATIRNLNVTGTVDGGRHSAGLVGTCSGSGVLDSISNCTVSVAVAVADYAGGIVGHGGNGKQLSIRNCVFSGSISGFGNCAGGIMGWSDSITLNMDNCLAKGSFSPASGGVFHPIACKLGGNNPVTATTDRLYYLYAIAPTVTSSGNTIAGAAGVPVSATRVPFEWTEAVTAADGLTYYATSNVTLTEGSGLVTLHDGDVLTGTGGADTRIVIAAGATVMLRNATISGSQASGITCEGDAVVVLNGANSVRGESGIVVPEGATLVFQGDGSMEAGSSGSGGGIVGAVTVGDGLIDVADGSTRRIIPGIDIFNDESNAAAIARHAGRTEAVCLRGRTLYRDGRYNTLCLPFSMSAAEIAASPLAGAMIKKLDNATSGLTGGTLTLDFKDVTEIEAGRPYVVRWPVLVISSAEDWNAFATKVTSGAESYEGWLVKLAADISISKMVGTDGTPFKGTFDGQGHTITVSFYSSGEGIALFYEIDGATIQNVRVKGSVVSTYRRPATFAAFVGGICTIQSCWSEVTILASNSDWVDAGAIVARVSSGGKLFITDCSFTGIIRYTSSSTYEGGGMVGWTQSNTYASLARCVFMPTEIRILNENSDSYRFVSGKTRGALSRCFCNSAVASSALRAEGDIYSPGMENGAENLVSQLLGNGWKMYYEGNKSYAGPKMDVSSGFSDAAIAEPLFANMTVSAATANVEIGAAEFVGVTSPVALGSGYRSALLVGDEGTLASPSAGATVNSCSSFFRLNNLSEWSAATNYVMNFGSTSVAGELDISTASGYELWASDNGIAGAAAATDANGVANVFRYAFDKPTGAFADPALLAIAFEGGHVVIYTPPLVNTEGFTFSIVATDALGGNDTATYPIDSSGRTEIPAANKPARFFRLRAVEAEQQ